MLKGKQKMAFYWKEGLQFEWNFHWVILLIVQLTIGIGLSNVGNKLLPEPMRA